VANVVVQEDARRSAGGTRENAKDNEHHGMALMETAVCGISHGQPMMLLLHVV